MQHQTGFHTKIASVPPFVPLQDTIPTADDLVSDYPMLDPQDKREQFKQKLAEHQKSHCPTFPKPKFLQ